MLYHLLYPLHDKLVGFGVFKYITFRAFLAFFTAMFISFFATPLFIRYMRRRALWQSIREDGPAGHFEKDKTPTMGGVAIWIGVFVATFICARWDTKFVPLSIGLAIAYAFVGFVDDYKKVILKDYHGLKARYKFPLQLALALCASLALFDGFGFDTHLSVPFFKNVTPDLGWFYVPIATLLIVGVSNAVNLTDGLDGLVTMPSIIAYMAYGVFCYIVGHAGIAAYLNVPFVPESGELAIVCTAIIGALLGFLWYNAQPADIFMGDVGSLPLGAVLALVAIVSKHEIVLSIVGGIFFLETMSVIVQVASFQLFGKRVLKMAPLHHHFELKGWKESKVIVRFWIVAFVLAVLSLSTLKLR